MMTSTQTETQLRSGPSTAEPHLCICSGQTASQLTASIVRHKLTTVTEVMNTTGSGTACFGCWEDIDALIARSSGAAPPPLTLSEAARLILVQTTIDDEIRPALRRHGGDIEFRELDGDRVRVRLSGSLAEERIDGFTHHDLAEGLLQELVAEELVLEAQA